MRKIFYDENLEAKFQKDGFVKVDFLNDAAVEKLKLKFFELLPLSGGLIHSDDYGIKKNQEMGADIDFTFIDKNIAFKEKVFEVIVETFMPLADQLLYHYKPIIANFIRKRSEGGEVPLHQNWAFIDETIATSVSIWCPLVDMGSENGTLQFVPGSHKRFGKIRGPMIPWELEGIKDDIINNDLVYHDMKAGQAIILDDSILHYSSINKTSNLRLAIQLILIPNELPSIHYHMNPSEKINRVNVLEVNQEFYMHFNPWKQPENAKWIKSIKYKPFQMNYRDFKKRLLSSRMDEKKSILDRIKFVFSK
jgi:ectoine hydroxylase-related dioxygenase (phytanoyl-CoA dioxygenase family)